MLVNLRVRDFAIIERVDLDFGSGFTVITGETGAGKSILVDALSLVLGGRASPSVVRTGSEQATVEALFDVTDHPRVRQRLRERELYGDDDTILLVRRIVSRKGRGKVLINGHLSSVATLAELVRGMVDISGQHEQQSLLVIENHLEILDAFAQLERERSVYSEAFMRLKQLQKELLELEANEENYLKNQDFLRFQLDEIDALNPQKNELLELEEEHRRLAHADRLHYSLSSAEQLLYGEDRSAFDLCAQAKLHVEDAQKVDPVLSELGESLESARRELEDVARGLQSYIQGIESDPNRLEEVSERLDALRRLCRKYGGSIEQVLENRDSLSEQLANAQDFEGTIAQLRSDVDEAMQIVQDLAENIHSKREQAALRLQQAIETELQQLELEGAKFIPRLERIDPDKRGCSKLEFLWSANVGEGPKGLAKIASGGELSRVMLGVKSVLRHRDLVSLYVFDEVDTGVGGKAADRIGEKIQSVAKGHQAITITHLAPIAARADHHLFVSKSVTPSEDGPRTKSTITPLRGLERAQELARMIDGTVSKGSVAAAQNMLQRAQQIHEPRV